MMAVGRSKNNAINHDSPETMTRSSISIFLVVVGLLWAGVNSWLFVAFGGLSQLAIDKALQWYSSLMFVGPLLLISGAVLTLKGTHCKAGSILSLVGCLVLTLMVAYHTMRVLLVREYINDGPPARPPYGLYAIAAIAVVLTLMADAGAVLFYRLASHTVARENQSAA